MLYIKDPAGVSRSQRGKVINDISTLNHFKHEEAGDPEIKARVAQYELV